VVPTNVISVALRRRADYMYEGEIADQRCLDRARWVFAIRAPVGEVDLIAKTPQLVKVCSKLFVPKLVERALPGMALTHLPRRPRHLRQGGRAVLQHHPVRPCWDHIVQSRLVGVYVQASCRNPNLSCRSFSNRSRESFMTPQPGSSTAARRNENLALAFQEILTAAERLRTGRQSIADATAFRYQILEGLKAADQQARTTATTPTTSKLAISRSALVDESVLNLRSPVFADWPRRPLQEELFGHHVAGRSVFQEPPGSSGEDRLARSRGSAGGLPVVPAAGVRRPLQPGGRGDLRAVGEAVAEKIRRIRGAEGEISPAWALRRKRSAGRGPIRW